MLDISEWTNDQRTELFWLIDNLDGFGLVVTDEELLANALGMDSPPEEEDICQSLNGL